MLRDFSACPRSANIAQYAECNSPRCHRKIENQSKVYFTYNHNQIDVNKTVSINATNQTLNQVLEQLFIGSDTGYKVEDGHIVLFKKDAPQVVAAGQKRTIKGIITDDKGVPVIGASILEKNTLNGTVTEIDGTYTMTLENLTSSWFHASVTPQKK